MASDLSLEEAATRIEEPVERLREWQSLGLIGDHARFRRQDVERARVIQLCLRQGIDLDSLVTAHEAGVLDELVQPYLDTYFPQREGPTHTLAEAADIVGLPLERARLLCDAAGLAEEREILGAEDVAVLRVAKEALELGFPEEALLQLLRVYSDAIGRVAEAESRLFHFYVHERLKAAGASGPELARVTHASAERLRSLADPVIPYFHRKGRTRAEREDVLLHLADEAKLTEKRDVPGQLNAAMVFVDLSSFTPLTEAMGDAKAAEVLGRFGALVRESAGRWKGRVVKQIGDAFMLVFFDARSALGCALEIEARAASEPFFPAVRSGVHCGSVLYREGDYVGATVNLAARAAAAAEPHQVLVTSAVRKHAEGLPDLEFTRTGRRQLKGMTDELDLYEVRPGSVAPPQRATDPVCGMQVGPTEVAARLSLEGKEQVFCSEECLRRFVAAPTLYLR